VDELKAHVKSLSNEQVYKYLLELEVNCGPVVGK
jgi:hypothetical protein